MLKNSHFVLFHPSCNSLLLTLGLFIFFLPYICVKSNLKSLAIRKGVFFFVSNKCILAPPPPPCSPTRGSPFKVAYYSFIRVQEVYTTNGKFRKLKGHETGGPCTIRGPGNELETCVFSIYAGTQKYFRRARRCYFH